MELDDLKSNWQDITSQVNSQLHLNKEKIDQMIQPNYYPSLKKIMYPEIAGVFICLVAAVFTVLNFNKLNSPFLQIAGILAVLLLLILSVTSIASIWQFTISRDATKPYAVAVKTFARQRMRFLKLQRFNAVLSYLLLVVTIVLMSKFFNGKDITGSKYFWIFSFSFGYIFLMFFSKWVSKYYNSTLLQTEELLKELAS